MLTVPGCPHRAAAVANAREAMARLGGRAALVERVIDDPDVARAAGMHGSPTVLVDGRDPFARSGVPGSLTCRLDDPPSVDALVAAMARPPGAGDHGE